MPIKNLAVGYQHYASVTWLDQYKNQRGKWNSICLLNIGAQFLGENIFDREQNCKCG